MNNGGEYKTESEFYTKKIILNNINDLMNIPIQQLRTAQLKNFYGSLFDQLYQEAMAIEHNQEIKIENKNLSQDEKIKKVEQKTIKNGASKKPIFYKISNKSINKSKDNRKKDNNDDKVYENKLKSSSVERNKLIKIKKKVKNNKSLNESDINEKMMNLSLNNSNLMPKKPLTVYNLNSNDLNQSESYSYFSPVNNSLNNINDIKINKIIFSIRYNTTFGEEIGILGSLPILGNWNQNGIFHLNWNNGNIWTGEINIENLSDFEFKFIISSGGNVKKWENGDNNKVNFDKLINEIKYKKKGYFNKYEYNFEPIKKELLLKCRWE
jgi:hypothetical protein